MFRSGYFERPGHVPEPKLLRLWPQHGGTNEFAFSQAGERFVGFAEREFRRLCVNLSFRRRGEEIDAILSGEICYRYDLPLAPKDIVGKCGNSGHVNAGANDPA